MTKLTPITIKEAAAIIGFSRQHIYYLQKAKGFPDSVGGAGSKGWPLLWWEHEVLEWKAKQDRERDEKLRSRACGLQGEGIIYGE